MCPVRPTLAMTLQRLINCKAKRTLKLHHRTLPSLPGRCLRWKNRGDRAAREDRRKSHLADLYPVWVTLGAAESGRVPPAINQPVCADQQQHGRTRFLRSSRQLTWWHSPLSRRCPSGVCPRDTPTLAGAQKVHSPAHGHTEQVVNRCVPLPHPPPPPPPPPW